MSKLKSIFKIQGLAYLLVAILMIVLAAGNSDLVDDFNVYWMATISAFVLGVLLLISKSGESIALFLSRIIVGGLFIVSGLIKANDTMGFAYKLQDYFDEKALGAFWENFYDFAQPLSILISGAEVLLGIAVLVGIWTRLSSWLILIMILFFTWLTHFTSDCVENSQYYKSVVSKINSGDSKLLKGDLEGGSLDYERAFYKYSQMNSPYIDSLVGVDGRQSIDLTKPDTAAIQELMKTTSPQFYWACVEDCGCFGDALKGSVGRSLTPTESFYKDLFILLFVLVIFFKQATVKINSLRDDVVIMPATLIVIALFGGGLFGWMFTVWFTVFVFALFLIIKKITVEGKKQDWIVFSVMAAVCFGFAIYTYTYLPIKDYRAYKLGDSIIDNRLGIEERNAKLPVDQQLKPMISATEYIYRNIKTKEDTVVLSSDYLEQRLYESSLYKIEEGNEKLLYKIVDYDGKTRVIQTGYSAPIVALSMESFYSNLDPELLSDPKIAEEIEFSYDPGYFIKTYQMRERSSGKSVNVPVDSFKDSIYPTKDSTWLWVRTFDSVITPPNDPLINTVDYFLPKEKQLWITSYEITHFNVDKVKEVKELAIAAKKKGITIAFIVNGSKENIEKFQEEHSFYFPYYLCDEKEIKVIVRSNPGLLYMEKGKVVNKWSYNSIPKIEELND